MTLPYFIFGCS